MRTSLFQSSEDGKQESFYVALLEFGVTLLDRFFFFNTDDTFPDLE